MKCPLCNQKFNQEDQLKQRYINFHNVGPNKHFFIKLSKPTKQKIIFQKCLRCDDFLATNKHKVLHNLLKHYSDDKIKPFEEKPNEIKITTYKIIFGNHGKFFDFSNSEEVVNDFLNNVRSKFKASSSVMIKCGFSIESIQPAPTEYNVPILKVRY